MTSAFPADKPCMESQVSEQSRGAGLSDRRRSPRRAHEVPGRLFNADIDSDPSGRPVPVLDLSLHGVGFRSPAALQVGEVYRLQIAGKWMELSARVRVVSCRLGDEGWDVGGEFSI